MIKGHYIEASPLNNRKGFSVSEELAEVLVLVGHISLCSNCSDSVLNVYHPEVPMDVLNDIIRDWIVNKYWHKEVQDA